MRRGTPRLRLLTCDAAVQTIRNRMPFRYGKAVLTAAPLLHVRVKVEARDGKQAEGFSADCLPPAWFDKDPSKDFRANVEDQLRAFRIARDEYLKAGQKPFAPCEIWEAACPRVLEEGARAGLNALTASFGSSFLERAVIDAACRLLGLSFFDVLRQDLLGIPTSKALPPKPPASICCRHTVGLSDPITVGEIPPQERLDDGLPQALEEDIALYDLRYFKVKASGDHDRDLERLSRIAALLQQRCKEGYAVSLDGNEQYGDAAGVERLIEALRSKPYGNELIEGILYIEQPIHRDAALDPAAAAGVARLSALKPVTIDESDDRLDSFERAIALGYQGTSHKNCKGVFKSLRNRDLLSKLNRERKKEKSPPLFMTGEDLVTVPVLPLQQDLASLAALGIEHAERNGHHYFHGLDHLPQREAASALAAHRDLYEERAGSIFLRIQNGQISLGSLQASGYGYACEIAFDGRTPLDAWSFEAVHGA
ncbi:MAG: mandelate racemase [Planctomycetes bacterium]|nr:mandelate racemase [Planctomycetota bacterium]